MNPILECKGLTRKFNHFFALSNVDLTLERGEIIGLLGPNGSGKTTLIKLINGLLLPTDGQITINGSVPGVETKKIVSYLECFLYQCSSFFFLKAELFHLFKKLQDMFGCETGLHFIQQLGIFCNKTSACPLRIYQSAPFQFGECFLHCVRIHGSFYGEIPDRGKSVTGFVDAGYDILLNTLHQL